MNVGAPFSSHRWIFCICHFLLLLGVAGDELRGQVFTWEYIDPLNPAAGRRESTTLAPDGASVLQTAFVNISNLDLTQAYFQGGSFLFADLRGTSLRRADLDGVGFLSVMLSGTDFTDAYVAGASFAGDGATSLNLTSSQLYSTSSYKMGNLQGIGFAGVNNWSLAGWDFSSLDVTDAEFSGVDLSGTSFADSVARNMRFEDVVVSAPLDLTGADLRGSLGVPLAGANTQNAILPDGRVTALDLLSSGTFSVRDYDGNPTATPTPIDPVGPTIEGDFLVDNSSTISVLLESDPWNSTISFSPGAEVELNGRLEIEFAPDVNLLSQAKRIIPLFDWSGIEVSGEFEVVSSQQWDLSRLYTTGEVEFLLEQQIPGDYDGDEDVDLDDFVMWRTTFGQPVASLGAGADGNSDGIINAADYVIWRDNHGIGADVFRGITNDPEGSRHVAGVAIPEPSTGWVVMLLLFLHQVVPYKPFLAAVKTEELGASE